MINKCDNKSSRLSWKPPSASIAFNPDWTPPASVYTDTTTMNSVEVAKAIEWLEDYTIIDKEQVYTNGAVLVPMFRVRQAFEDRAYNGLFEG